MISVAELIRYRLQHERFVRRVAEGCVETEFGEFRTIAYTSDLNPENTPGAGARRSRGPGGRAGAHALPLPLRRRLRFHRTATAASWCATRSGAIADEGAGVLVYLHETGPGFRVQRRTRPGAHGVAYREFMHYQGEPASGSCSTSTASARRFCPTWACTPSAC